MGAGRGDAPPQAAADGDGSAQPKQGQWPWHLFHLDLVTAPASANNHPMPLDTYPEESQRIHTNHLFRSRVKSHREDCRVGCCMIVAD